MRVPVFAGLPILPHTFEQGVHPVGAFHRVADELIGVLVELAFVFPEKELGIARDHAERLLQIVRVAGIGSVCHRPYRAALPCEGTGPQVPNRRGLGIRPAAILATFAAFGAAETPGQAEMGSSGRVRPGHERRLALVKAPRASAYYTIRRAADIRIFQVTSKGGEPAAMPQLDGMLPLDISSDRSELLLAQITNETGNGPYPLWVATALGSAPRRLADVTAEDARWSPKGDQIVYCAGTELRIAQRDGAQSRRLATVDGHPFDPGWSPDGRAIRFTLAAKNSATLWEVSEDGSHMHPLFPEWANHTQAYGAWTPDDKYFVFAAGKTTSDIFDIWAFRESTGFFRMGGRSPVRLTTGPIDAAYPTPSPDGKRIFFIGTLDRGELVRYDRKWPAKRMSRPRVSK